MRIGLIAGIPDNQILGSVQQVMKSDGQFNDTEIRSEVPADVRDHGKNLVTNFLAQIRKLFG